MSGLLEIQHVKHGAGSVVLMHPVTIDDDGNGNTDDDRLLLLVRCDKPYIDAKGRRRRAGWHWWRDPALDTDWTYNRET